MSRILLLDKTIKISCKGDLKLTTKFLTKVSNGKLMNDIKRNVLAKYGEQGVRALEEHTPKDTGLTAKSWNYEIDDNGENFVIRWTNSNVKEIPGRYSVNIAVLIQYGHGTNGGGYVQGRDYINPALQPIFDKIAKDAWQEVTNS